MNLVLRTMLAPYSGETKGIDMEELFVVSEVLAFISYCRIEVLTAYRERHSRCRLQRESLTGEWTLCRSISLADVSQVCLHGRSSMHGAVWLRRIGL